MQNKNEETFIFWPISFTGEKKNIKKENQNSISEFFEYKTFFNFMTFVDHW